MAPSVILLLLDDMETDAGIRLLELCMSVSDSGVNVRLATNPSHVATAFRRSRPVARVLILAGLDVSDYDAVDLTFTLGVQPDFGVIVMEDDEVRRDQALGAGADLVLPLSIDREEFRSQVQWLLGVYEPADSAWRRVDDGWNPLEEGSVVLDTVGAAAAQSACRFPSFPIVSWWLIGCNFRLYLPNSCTLALDVHEYCFMEALFLAKDARLSPQQCQDLMAGIGTPVAQEQSLIQIIHRLHAKCKAARVRLPLQGHPRSGYAFLEPCGLMERWGALCRRTE